MSSVRNGKCGQWTNADLGIFEPDVWRRLEVGNHGKVVERAAATEDESLEQRTQPRFWRPIKPALDTLGQYN